MQNILLVRSVFLPKTDLFSSKKIIKTPLRGVIHVKSMYYVRIAYTFFFKHLWIRLKHKKAMVYKNKVCWEGNESYQHSRDDGEREKTIVLFLVFLSPLVYTYTMAREVVDGGQRDNVGVPIYRWLVLSLIRAITH